MLGLERDVAGQYFGRNKVQYKDLHFQVLKTEHFDIYFYPEAREGTDIAARFAERWHARLQKLFDYTLRGRQPLILYASPPDFQQTNVIPGELGEGTGGVTESVRRRIVLPLAGPLSDSDHVIGHELVHAFQYDMTTNPNAGQRQPGAGALPLWFIEGMAEYISVGPVDSNTAMWLRDAAREEKLPTIEDLDNPKYFPYRWGQAFWAFVGARYGDDVIGQMLDIGGAAGDYNVAIQNVLGITTKELSAEWHNEIRRAYESVLRVTTAPDTAGRRVVSAADVGGDLNVGPALSPDGRKIAFLSERGLFSIDLFVADVATGRVERKLTSTATDPHTSSLQFIYSAGTWDNTSQRIAVGTMAGAQPELVIFNAVTGRRERELPIEGVDEILNPTWAPDGASIAFTGLTRGLIDLYVYDLSSATVRRLTNDAYAEVQPAWSPDGARLAFATDRFSTDLQSLDIGRLGLATLDIQSGAVAPVQTFQTGKSMNPQWSPDGRALYFISDRDGIPNLYRVAIASGDVAQFTNVATGLSGITGSSPALSVARQAGIAAFTVYDKGKYDIYSIEDKQQTGALQTLPVNAAILPPIDRKPTTAPAMLANPTTGLPPPTEYPVEPYRTRMTLEAIAPPTVSVGASRYGAAIGGGIAFQFADMLRNHSLTTAVQLNSGISGNYSLKNTVAQVMYFNQSHRWNWGVIGGQVPYLSGGYQRGFGSVQGQSAIVDQSVIYRQTERSVAGVAAYPFNRAQRLEFQAGATQMSFDQIVRVQAYSATTGQRLADETEETSLAAPLTLASSSAALVFDTSVFGATSPVQGQRYRFEATPTFGSINFTSVLADYRRYLMPFRFYTIAARGMHYGRYGTGGQDQRLFPLFIGYPNLVRGYSVGSFTQNECVANTLSTCPAFEQLMGSRVLVGNLELRFPLLRPFGVSQRMYGPIPTEVALFADGGVAWNRGERPEFFGGARRGVASVGVAFRVNLMGFAIGQFDVARPLQRPGRGWVFQFNLSPGF